MRTYAMTLAVLLALTALTVGVSFLDLGPFHMTLALAIAAAKASLVLLFFMHVRHGDALTRLVVAGGFFWLGLLIVLTLGDYLTRK